MSDLQRDLRAYIDHLADLAEQDPRSQTAPIPRRHARPPRYPRPVLVGIVAAAVTAGVIGWIALNGSDDAPKISTPPASKATDSTSPPGTVAPLPPTDALWDAIATCETGGNWDAPGQKYQGGLGIYSANWEHYGGSEFAPTAGQATREQQIAIAERIRAEHGLGAWGCAVTLGFVRTPDAYVDKYSGFSATIPAGWERQQLVNPAELLRATSLELVNTCGGTAVTYAGWVTVREIPMDSSPDPEPRPAVFGPTSGTGSSAPPSACEGDIPISTTQSIVFVETGRKIQVTLNFYPGASLANRAEAYELLTSTHFKPARALQRGRPASEVRVFVRDASGTPIALNILETSGYTITDSVTVEPQAATTVACRDGHRADARGLVRLFGEGGVIKPYPDPAPRRAEGADCIVTVGAG